MTKNSVCVVTVTYGDRWNILKEVMEVLIDNPVVKKIIVVDNDSKNDLTNAARQLSDKIQVIKMNSNTGSAYGYKVGISRALEDKNSEYIWLLDDDNKPEKDALDELIVQYDHFQNNTSKNLLALLSLRDDRKEFILASKHQEAEKFFPMRNSCLGVHYKDLFKKVLNKIHKKSNNTSDGNQHIVKVPLAPYGGLFFHKSLINTIGLPNDQFYLYSDDYEFSNRIIKSSGKIILIPSSRISDIDKSWFIKENNGFFLSLFKSDSEVRIYYSIRNRIYFETKELVNNRFIYSINKTLFLTLIQLASIFYKKKDRKDLIKRAMSDGFNERLGKVDIL
ncbi:glycosyltransferase [Neobacillus sp. SuZ13]|uniref:glycosyltransferase n=1 Tax=Neobacillus sp. SuZ13 TaxID=3047875 RepID=UPI0024C02C22|nr:glycosyltransferase [Neobacillus sp. SuZ13]WHY66796.1 glycosyltransferase [Neobacillus sp. SuZ13]